MDTYFKSRSPASLLHQQELRRADYANGGRGTEVAVDADALTVFVLVDCRRGLGDTDKAMLELLLAYGLQHEVIYTKADQMGKSKLEEEMARAAL